MDSFRLPACSITAAAVQGDRDTFEDRIDIHVGLNPAKRFVYGAVFDGHGGSAAAVFAQKKLFQILKETPNFISSNLSTCAESVAASFKQVQTEMKVASRHWTGTNKIPRDGTTASIAVLTVNYLMLANVGDSPIFVVSRDENNKLTATLGVKLHTPNYTPDHARIKAAGGDIRNFKGSLGILKGRRVRGQFNGYVRMTRAFGDFWMQDIDAGDSNPTILSHHPMVYFHEIPNLAYVVIASDGCSLGENDIAKVLMKIEVEEKEEEKLQCFKSLAQNPSQRIIAEIQRKTQVNKKRFDNISVICIRILNHPFGKDHQLKLPENDNPLHLTPQFAADDNVAFCFDVPNFKKFQTEFLPDYQSFKGLKHVITYG